MTEWAIPFSQRTANTARAAVHPALFLAAPLATDTASRFLACAGVSEKPTPPTVQNVHPGGVPRRRQAEQTAFVPPSTAQAPEEQNPEQAGRARAPSGARIHYDNLD
jgi:hypothetical protein